MTCAEFKELCGAFALGALDEDERAACEAHLAEAAHEGCPEALDVARSTVNALPLALPPVRPRPEIWERIAREVSPGLVAAQRRRVWPAVVGAVLLAAALILLFVERRERETVLAGAKNELTAATNLRRACQEELDGLKREAQIHREAVALLAAPGAKLVTMKSRSMSGDHAVIIMDAWGGKAALLAHGFDAQPGKGYEVWVIKGDMKKDAGLPRAEPSGA